jgi:3D (Asp-Asp-Asp) domain-containing protein
MTVQTTWYTAAQGAWAADDPNYGKTYTGARVGYGVCAVDPSVIPLYTKMYIPGYGYCTALDTGGNIKGASVDLGFPDGTTQSGWGAPVIDIYILD